MSTRPQSRSGSKKQGQTKPLRPTAPPQPAPNQTLDMQTKAATQFLINSRVVSTTEQLQQVRESAQLSQYNEAGTNTRFLLSIGGRPDGSQIYSYLRSRLEDLSPLERATLSLLSCIPAPNQAALQYCLKEARGQKLSVPIVGQDQLDYDEQLQAAAKKKPARPAKGKAAPPPEPEEPPPRPATPLPLSVTVLPESLLHLLDICEQRHLFDTELSPLLPFLPKTEQVCTLSTYSAKRLPPQFSSRNAPLCTVIMKGAELILREALTALDTEILATIDAPSVAQSCTALAARLSEFVRPAPQPARPQSSSPQESPAVCPYSTQSLMILASVLSQLNTALANVISTSLNSHPVNSRLLPDFIQCYQAQHSLLRCLSIIIAVVAQGLKDIGSLSVNDRLFMTVAIFTDLFVAAIKEIPPAIERSLVLLQRQLDLQVSRPFDSFVTHDTQDVLSVTVQIDFCRRDLAAAVTVIATQLEELVQLPSISYETDVADDLQPLLAAAKDPKAKGADAINGKALTAALEQRSMLSFNVMAVAVPLDGPRDLTELARQLWDSAVQHAASISDLLFTLPNGSAAGVLGALTTVDGCRYVQLAHRPSVAAWCLLRASLESTSTTVYKGAAGDVEYMAQLIAVKDPVDEALLAEVEPALTTRGSLGSFCEVLGANPPPKTQTPLSYLSETPLTSDPEFDVWVRGILSLCYQYRVEAPAAKKKTQTAPSARTKKDTPTLDSLRVPPELTNTKTGDMIRRRELLLRLMSGVASCGTETFSADETVSAFAVALNQFPAPESTPLAMAQMLTLADYAAARGFSDVLALVKRFLSPFTARAANSRPSSSRSGQRQAAQTTSVPLSSILASVASFGDALSASMNSLAQLAGTAPEWNSLASAISLIPHQSARLLIADVLPRFLPQALKSPFDGLFDVLHGALALHSAGGPDVKAALTSAAETGDFEGAAQHLAVGSNTEELQFLMELCPEAQRSSVLAAVPDQGAQLASLIPGSDWLPALLSARSFTGEEAVAAWDFACEVDAPAAVRAGLLLERARCLEPDNISLYLDDLRLFEADPEYSVSVALALLPFTPDEVALNSVAERLSLDIPAHLAFPLAAEGLAEALALSSELGRLDVLSLAAHYLDPERLNLTGSEGYTDDFSTKLRGLIEALISFAEGGAARDVELPTPPTGVSVVQPLVAVIPRLSAALPLPCLRNQCMSVPHLSRLMALRCAPLVEIPTLLHGLTVHPGDTLGDRVLGAQTLASLTPLIYQNSEVKVPLADAYRALCSPSIPQAALYVSPLASLSYLPATTATPALQLGILLPVTDSAILPPETLQFLSLLPAVALDTLPLLSRLTLLRLLVFSLATAPGSLELPLQMDTEELTLAVEAGSRPHMLFLALFLSCSLIGATLPFIPQPCQSAQLQGSIKEAVMLLHIHLCLQAQHMYDEELPVLVHSFCLTADRTALKAALAGNKLGHAALAESLSHVCPTADDTRAACLELLEQVTSERLSPLVSSMRTLLNREAPDSALLLSMDGPTLCALGPLLLDNALRFHITQQDIPSCQPLALALVGLRNLVRESEFGCSLNQTLSRLTPAKPTGKQADKAQIHPVLQALEAVTSSALQTAAQDKEIAGIVIPSYSGGIYDLQFTVKELALTKAAIISRTESDHNTQSQVPPNEHGANPVSDETEHPIIYLTQISVLQNLPETKAPRASSAKKTAR